MSKGHLTDGTEIKSSLPIFPGAADDLYDQLSNNEALDKLIFKIGSDTAFSILARSNELIKRGKDVINLGIGQPDFPTPPTT